MLAFSVLNSLVEISIRTKLKRKFKHLGPEPFSKFFNVNYISNYFKKKEKNIKNFLLDQKFVSGIGNIYANEILYYSKIKPIRKVKSFNKAEI